MVLVVCVFLGICPAHLSYLTRRGVRAYSHWLFLGLIWGQGQCSTQGTFSESKSDPAPPPLTPIRGCHLTQGESQVGSPHPLSLTSSPTLPATGAPPGCQARSCLRPVHGCSLGLEGRSLKHSRGWQASQQMSGDESARAAVIRSQRPAA